MMLDDGYIKYQSSWTIGPGGPAAAVLELEKWRRPLHDAGLIGVYEEHNIGFGNLSLRMPAHRQFLISGTQTGHMKATTNAHYSLVTDYDIDANRVACTGPVQASSEAMTHAAIYELDDAIGAVVHVHSRSLWQECLGKLPTTDAMVSFGTPQMAREFSRLFAETSFSEQGLAVMAGHDEGIVSFGTSLKHAATRIIELNSA